MELHPCPSCTELVTVGTCVCPHCGDKACRRPGISKGAAVLLGLSLVACGGKDDSGSTTSSPQPEYGVTVTGTTTPSSREAAAYAEAVGERSIPVDQVGSAVPHED